MSWQLITFLVAIGSTALAGTREGVRIWVRRTAGKFFGAAPSYVVGTYLFGAFRLLNDSVARQVGLKRYARLMRSRFPSYLVVPSATDIRVDIDSTYVTLGLSSGGRRRLSDSELVTARYRGVLIFGDAGSGKSSLTRKVFREACRIVRDGSGDCRLPLHLELRKIPWSDAPDDAKECASWMLDYLRSELRQMPGLYQPDFLLDSFLHRSGVVLLLDGLDEISSVDMRKACLAIRSLFQDLAGRSAESTIIVTARTQLRDALPRDLIDEFQMTLTIEPFSTGDIYTFLRRWPYEPDRHGDAARVYADLQSQPTLAEMCTNPLVLSMYVARDQLYASNDTGRPIRLPDTRAEFYNDILSELILFRREGQVGRVALGGQLRRTREEVLGKIALDHLARPSEPANSIPWHRAVETVSAVLGLDHVGADRELRTLAVHTGVFVEERRTETLRFLHLTLCEYLAASELAETSEQVFETVIGLTLGAGFDGESSTSDRKRLWETVCFCATALGRDRRYALIQRIHTAGGSTELLLRVVRESQAYDSPVFPKCVEVVCDELENTPVADWDALWFNHLKLVLSCLLDASRVAKVRKIPPMPTGAEFLERIVRSDSSRFGIVYATYLRISPVDALDVAEQYDGRIDVLEPSRLAGSMDESGIVTLGVSRIRGGLDDGNDSMSWILALAEASLRYELVAEILVKDRSSRLLRFLAGGVPRRFRWHLEPELADSTLGAILAVATERVGSLSAGVRMGLPRLGLLAEVDPRQDQRRIPAGTAFPTLGLVAAGAFVLGVTGATYFFVAAQSYFTVLMVSLLLVIVSCVPWLILVDGDHSSSTDAGVRAILPDDPAQMKRIIQKQVRWDPFYRPRGDYILLRLNGRLHGFARRRFTGRYTVQARDEGARRLATFRVRSTVTNRAPIQVRSRSARSRANAVDNLSALSELSQVFLVLDEIETFEYVPPEPPSWS